METIFLETQNSSMCKLRTAKRCPPCREMPPEHSLSAPQLETNPFAIQAIEFQGEILTFSWVSKPTTNSTKTKPVTLGGVWSSETCMCLRKFVRDETTTLAGYLLAAIVGGS